MATNPLIALQVRTPNVFDSFQKGRLQALEEQQAEQQAQRQNRLLDLQEQKFASQQQNAELQRQAAQLKITEEKRRLRGQAAAETAMALDPLIERGDFQGALQLLDTNYNRLTEQGLRAPDPVGLREALRRGDAESARQLTSGIINLSRQLGFIPQEPKSTSPREIQLYEYARQQGYTGSFDDFLQQAAARSASAAPYYTPLQTSTGLYRFDARSGNIDQLQGPQGAPLLPVAIDPAAQAAVTGAKEAAKVTSKARAQAVVDLPQARHRIESINRSIDNVVSQIDELIGGRAQQPDGSFIDNPGLIDWTTVGPGGALMSSIPSTPARYARGIIGTIKANIGFDKLQEMRDLSPTGGALGQVAVQELEGLQASIASLDPSMSPTQLRANLKRVRDHYAAWKKAVTKHYQQRYGQDAAGGAQQPAAPAPAQPAGPVRVGRFVVEVVD